MIETDAIAIAEQVNALVIKNKDDFVAAGELAVAVARMIKQKNEQWRTMFERANESAKQIKTIGIKKSYLCKNWILKYPENG